ncbi:hypothetical protein [Mesoflavibacter sp. CH_XMU1404-2]|uniref:hypothetical protein n=1 Tax=Mesoflavibacter sp. CH_XMU1404-2 TaxID=3107766 RepID=UPI0030091932
MKTKVFLIIFISTCLLGCETDVKSSNVIFENSEKNQEVIYEVAFETIEEEENLSNVKKSMKSKEIITEEEHNLISEEVLETKTETIIESKK